MACKLIVMAYFESCKIRIKWRTKLEICENYVKLCTNYETLGSVSKGLLEQMSVAGFIVHGYCGGVTSKTKLTIKPKVCSFLSFREKACHLHQWQFHCPKGCLYPLRPVPEATQVSPLTLSTLMESAPFMPHFLNAIYIFCVCIHSSGR